MTPGTVSSELSAAVFPDRDGTIVAPGIADASEWILRQSIRKVRATNIQFAEHYSA